MNCPNCQRETFSKKWGTCTGCGYRHLGKIDVKRLENVVPVTNNVTRPLIKTDLKSGRGGVREGAGRKRVWDSEAERKRVYRERGRA